MLVLDIAALKLSLHLAVVLQDALQLHHAKLFDSLHELFASDNFFREEEALSIGLVIRVARAFYR